MKTSFLLFFILLILASMQSKAGLPPTSLKGQSGAKATTFNFEVPNNTATKTNTGGLIETGNKNILTNGSFEHSNFKEGWNHGALAPVEEISSTVIDGKKIAVFNPSAQEVLLTNTSTLYASAFGLGGVQGLAMCRINSNVALKMCSINNSVTSTTNCVDVNTDAKWGLYKVPFILGETNNGVSIASSGNVTGTVYVDDCFVGPQDLKQDVSGAIKVGSIRFSGCASWWTSTSTSYAAMGTTSCTVTTTGNVSAPTTNIPGFRLLNRQAGKYKFEASGEFIKSVSTTNSTIGFVFRDTTSGTNSQNENIAQHASSAGGVLSVPFIKGDMEYTNSGDTSFEIYGKTSTTTSGTQAGITNFAPLVIDVFYFPPNSQVYSSQNADTDWASCNFSTLAWQGLGTVTNNLECKRRGSDLLMRGRFTVGTLSVAEMRMPLPMWNGSQLAIKLINTNTQSAGTFYRYAASEGTIINVIAENALTYLGFSNPLATTTGYNPITRTSGAFASGEGAAINGTLTIPIIGWENSNHIIGSFKEIPTTLGSSGADIQSVYFGSGADCATNCSTGTCVICNRGAGSKITSITWQSTGVYRLNGIDGTKYNCGLDGYDTVNGYVSGFSNRVVSTSAYAQVYLGQSGTNRDGRSVNANCVGIP
jgi:hypothetical protein